MKSGKPVSLQSGKPVSLQSGKPVYLQSLNTSVPCFGSHPIKTVKPLKQAKFTAFCMCCFWSGVFPVLL